MAIRPLRLNEYLATLNIPGELNLPWVHSTSASNLMDIIADGKLLATPCNVFRKDKLCYFFIGRPAYKMKPTENPSAWQLPIAFVVRFEKAPPIKRAFPFDSGAFHQRRLPDYITTFKMDGYNISGNPDLLGRVISFYFKTPGRYFHRRPAAEEEITEQHSLDMRHAEIIALSRLYHENSSPDCDDRAAAIELQIDQDIEIKKENLLGIVIPAEYARIDELMKSMHALTKNIEVYDLYPLGLTHHFSLLYDRVKSIYKSTGIPIE